MARVKARKLDWSNEGRRPAPPVWDTMHILMGDMSHVSRSTEGRKIGVLGCLVHLI